MGRVRSRRKCKTKKKTHNQKKTAKSIFPTSETPTKILRRCLARSQNLGHTQKEKNNRVATATKLSVACPKTPSKVRVLGARDLCALQQQRRRKEANTKNKRAATTKKRTLRAPNHLARCVP